MTAFPTRDVSGPEFRFLEARISPEILTPPKPGAARRPGSVPRGNEPANGGRRPILAAVSVAIFLFAVWTQAERWSQCRGEGGTRIECFLQPAF